MIRKFVEAKRNRKPTEELFGGRDPVMRISVCRDCAHGFVLAALHYDGPEPVNLGTHKETTIKVLAQIIKRLHCL